MRQDGNGPQEEEADECVPAANRASLTHSMSTAPTYPYTICREEVGVRHGYEQVMDMRRSWTCVRHGYEQVMDMSKSSMMVPTLKERKMSSCAPVQRLVGF